MNSIYLLRKHWRTAMIPLLAAAAIVLAACGASTPTSPAVPIIPSTGLDPCQLVTSSEASKLAGTTFGEGEEETDVGGMKSCVYGSNTNHVFTVEVVQAADADSAKAQEGQFMAALQSQIPSLASDGLKISQVPNLGDAAIAGETNIAGGINGSAIGVAKGNFFFGFSCVVTGGPAPSSAAMEEQAKVTLDRVH